MVVDPTIVRRIAAAEIEPVVMAQVRALIRQPEVIVGTWQAARAEAPDLTEDEVRTALEQFEPMWDELFPGEQARIEQALVERVTWPAAALVVRWCRAHRSSCATRPDALPRDRQDGARPVR